eukprot:TRINITY_DN6919_c3_g1_i1.p1 TRINITY_DN6919_c3_g1~~TRINITY_DN6919_c3_g1_i1.p1  ORF type:complete len:188 (-),score=29.50 TRINITY_DN6919_c3_g1_i1:125-688(-)
MMASQSSSEFEWPVLYSYPPFYTLQTNLDTRAKQVDAWCNLILNFFKYNKLHVLDLTEALASSPLFVNSSLNRTLSRETASVMLNVLESRGNLEWQDKEKDRCLVMWRTPKEWGALIYQWASENGFMNTVCTVYELHSGEDTVSEEFYGLDLIIVVKALQTLQTDGKAQIIQRSNPDMSDAGVKFFG